MRRLELPRLAPLERAWLTLSLQRYALLLALLAATPVAALALVGASSGAAALVGWALALVFAAVVGARAVEVARRGPAKLHALRVALHRQRRGDFEPAQLRRHCGDPCFRVVAHEALRRAGVDAAERRRLVAAYARELRDEASALVIVDHLRGEIRRTVGGRSETLALTGDGAPEASAP